ncbi:hypothetical protein ACRRTK_004286 [Alexandromys fortis]
MGMVHTVVAAVGKVKQEEYCKSEASMGCTARRCLSKPDRKKTGVSETDLLEEAETSRAVLRGLDQSHLERTLSTLLSCLQAVQCELSPMLG